MPKAATVFLLLILVFLLASCAAAETQSQATVPPNASVSDAITPSPGTSAIPGTSPGSEPQPIPTTEPDIDPVQPAEPEAKPSPTPTVVPAGIVKNSGEIIGTDVAFRTQPNTESELITRLNRGTYVQILKTNVDAQWHQVKYNDKTGYINRMYICLDSSLDGFKLDFFATIVN